MGCVCGKRRKNIPFDNLSRVSSKKLASDSMSKNKFKSSFRSTTFLRDDFDPRDYKPTPISDYDKVLIKETWKMFTSAPPVLRNTAAVLTRCFVLTPELLNSYAALESVESSVDIRDYSMELRVLKTAMTLRHMRYFMDFIDEILPLMDHWKAFMEKAKALGQRHFDRNVHPSLLKTFYCSFIESAITFGFVCWYGSLSVVHMVNVCNTVIGRQQASVDTLYEQRVHICGGFLFALEKCLFPHVDKQLIKAWEQLLLGLAYYWDRGYWVEMAHFQGTYTPGSCSRNRSPVDHAGMSPVDFFEAHLDDHQLTVLKKDLMKETNLDLCSQFSE